MSSIYSEKIRQNADLVVPFTGCPFGDPIEECPFIQFHELEDEHKQIKKIDSFSQCELDELRGFHRECMGKLMKTREVNFKKLPY